MAPASLITGRDETRILSWSYDNTVPLWDVATTRQIGPADAARCVGLGRAADPGISCSRRRSRGGGIAHRRSHSQRLRCSSRQMAVPQRRLPYTNGSPDGIRLTCSQSSPDSSRRYRRQRLSACTDRWGRCTAWGLSVDLHHSSCWRAVPQQRLPCTNGSLDGTRLTCNQSLRCTLLPHCRLSAPARSYYCW